MRRPTSCVQCRAMKRRCVRAHGTNSCEQCRHTNTDCSLLRSAHSQSTRLLSVPDLQTSTYRDDDILSGLLSESTIEELVGNYLTFIHDRPHSLFHRATLWHNIRNETISKHLLYSICSLGARLSESSQQRDLGSQLFTSSKKLLLANIENVSLENIQTCILLANVFAADLNPASETLFFGIANRMAQIIKLQIVEDSDDAVLKEIKRRTWWTLIMADAWCSNGLGIPCQLESHNTDVELPMDEHVFQNAPMDAAQHLLESPYRGLWAYMITLVSIFGPIHDLNRRLVEDRLSEDVIAHTVFNLTQQLDAWKASLPDHMHLSDSNLDYNTRRGLGGPYVALHLGYFHYCTVLYFQYLDMQRVRNSTTETYSNRCKDSALSYSRLLADTRERSGCEAIYATVGHMTVISSAVLLHILLFGHEDEVEEARHSLTANFEALIDLKRYWPSLDRTISRLSVFQTACLNSTRTNTHHIDQWMVRFLLEHSLPLENRPEHPIAGNTHGPAQATSARELAASDAIASLWV